jgi:hypothetical protein
MKKSILFAAVAVIAAGGGLRYSRRSASPALSPIERQSLHDAPNDLNDGEQASGSVWSRLKDKFGLDPAKTPAVAAPAAAPTTVSPAETLSASADKIQALTDAIVKSGRGFLRCRLGNANSNYVDVSPLEFSGDGDDRHATTVRASCYGHGHECTIFTSTDLGDKFMVHKIDGTPYLIFKPLVPQTVAKLADLKEAIVSVKDVNSAIYGTVKAFKAQDAAEAKSDLSDIQKDTQAK